MTTPGHAELTWRKSSHSNTNNGDCVEVATTARAAAVRDSKAPAAGHLTLGAAAWRAFLTAVRR
ncbi:DUF397 domain-containing protein [Amycolatopsis aidingensis]|uniref:DUF397 domain-containing protein n=1 Tax=Amycolatopsis aidingensis TaxID=2842453 RepID=UPI001C0D95D6|nr:DUF397 domain-containing protein [Amycolatopsis aidingensis]